MDAHKTSRIYHYHVSIVFKGIGATARIGRKTSGYSSTHPFQDTFVFYQKSCHLVLSRTKKYDDGGILSNASNSINTQIVKALLCYYSITSDFPLVDKITIVRRSAKTPDYAYREASGFIQPLVSKALRTLSCTPAIVDGLVENSQRGHALRIAMSYWLKGISSDDVYYKFEHLWRAFDRLFLYQGNKPTDHENMVIMRQFILHNSASFPKSIAITNGYSEDKFLSYRWVRMILNDYATQNKTAALVDFIERHHDGRIMRMLQQKLACRNEFLANEGKIGRVNSYIASNLTTTIDAELVTLLAIKYAYFVRNKMFHGEVIDRTFRVRENNLDVEMRNLNELLEVLVMELMENYHLLRA